MRYFKDVNNGALYESDFVLLNCMELTEEEYNSHIEQNQAHARLIDEYVQKVRDGEITLDDIPSAEDRTEVEDIINAPQPEESNNDYGIPNELYDSIIDDYTNELIEGGIL